MFSIFWEGKTFFKKAVKKNRNSYTKAWKPNKTPCLSSLPFFKLYLVLCTIFHGGKIVLALIFPFCFYPLVSSGKMKMKEDDYKFTLKLWFGIQAKKIFCFLTKLKQ